MAVKYKDFFKFKSYFPHFLALSGCQSFNFPFQIEFITRYIPAHVKIHLIGHSFGSYVITQLLKNEEINKRIHKAYLLFPAIDHVGGKQKICRQNYEKTHELNDFRIIQRKND